VFLQQKFTRMFYLFHASFLKIWGQSIKNSSTYIFLNWAIALLSQHFRLTFVPRGEPPFSKPGSYCVKSHNFLNPFSPAWAPFWTWVCNFLQLHNSPANWGRELFKPSTDLASLLVYFEKNLFGLGFAMDDVTMGACLHNFMAEVTWP